MERTRSKPHRKLTQLGPGKPSALRVSVHPRQRSDPLLYRPCALNLICPALTSPAEKARPSWVGFRWGLLRVLSIVLPSCVSTPLGSVPSLDGSSAGWLSFRGASCQFSMSPDTLWTIYGCYTGDGPLIVANLATLVPAGIVLERKLQAVRATRK